MASEPSASPDASTPTRDLDAAIGVLMESADPAARRVGDALARWRGEQGASLDRALGLRRRGGVSPARAADLKCRDAVLRHLAREHPGWSGAEPGHVARQMRKAFDRYETGRWRRDRASPIAPAGEPAASFWRILRNGWPMPQVDRLRQILAREIQ